MANRIYLRKEEASKLGWYSRKELKELFRLKPAPDQVFAGEVWQGYTSYLVFDKEHCVAMRPYRKPTKKQLAALAFGRSCRGTRKCRTDGCTGRAWYDADSYRERVCCSMCIEQRRIASVRHDCLSFANHEKPLCFLDTETTGLDEQAEIVEIAIVDRNGNTLLDTLIKPLSPIPPEASAIHGIYGCDVANAPSFTDVFNQVEAIFESHLVLIYNSEFDIRLIQQSAAKHGIEFNAGQYSTGCIMRLYAKYWNDYSSYHDSYTWQSLVSAAAQCDIETKGQAHRARTDCLTTLSVFKHMKKNLNL